MDANAQEAPTLAVPSLRLQNPSQNNESWKLEAVSFFFKQNHQTSVDASEVSGGEKLLISRGQPVYVMILYDTVFRDCSSSMSSSHVQSNSKKCSK